MRTDTRSSSLDVKVKLSLIPDCLWYSLFQVSFSLWCDFGCDDLRSLLPTSLSSCFRVYFILSQDSLSKVLLMQYRSESLSYSYTYSYSRSDHYSSVFPSSFSVDLSSVKKDPHVMHCFWFFAFSCHSFSLLTPMKMQLHSFSLISFSISCDDEGEQQWASFTFLFIPVFTFIPVLLSPWLPTESDVPSDGTKLSSELKSMGASTRFFTCIHLSQDNSFSSPLLQLLICCPKWALKRGPYFMSHHQSGRDV